jgi:1-acyl-sn-glycerol-3-phosphate acyltransferase
MKIIPVSKKIKMLWFHKILSKFMKSVFASNPFIKTRIINPNNELFNKQAVIIANHTSFLDILAIGMLHPKIIFLVNDWVYNSPIFGKTVQAAGFYPVSSGIENGLSHLQAKVDQGYSLMVFPEGTRSLTNKMKRFHKGAFYLAEQFNLDIIPILIHGNSEILPKGNFVVQKGTLSLKILNRVLHKDQSYGVKYKERTKKISIHFKHQFNIFRKEVENDSYFHNIVLQDYRYKGDALYKTVKKDLKKHKEIYNVILNTIDKKVTIIHISKDYGQLDFLLSLNAIERKIISYIENANVKQVLQNSHITNKYNNINFENTIEATLKNHANVLILNINEVSIKQINNILNENINLLILLKESRNLYLDTINDLGFESYYENENLIVFKR